MLYEQSRELLTKHRFLNGTDIISCKETSLSCGEEPVLGKENNNSCDLHHWDEACRAEPETSV